MIYIKFHDTESSNFSNSKPVSVKYLFYYQILHNFTNSKQYLIKLTYIRNNK